MALDNISICGSGFQLDRGTIANDNHEGREQIERNDGRREFIPPSLSMKAGYWQDEIEKMYGKSSLLQIPSFIEEMKKFNWKDQLSQIRHQLNKNTMQNLTQTQLEKVEKTNNLAQQIDSLKTLMAKTRNSHSVGGGYGNSPCFMYGSDPIQIPIEHINFPVLKSSVLASMSKKLKELEKEFDSI